MDLSPSEQKAYRSWLHRTQFADSTHCLRSFIKAGKLPERYDENARLLPDIFVEPIDHRNANPKLASLAASFESTLQTPLVKKFLRTTPKLYRAHSKDYVHVGSLKGKYILVEKSAAEELSAGALNFMVKHELGHFLAAEDHYRRTEDKLNQERAYQREFLADRIAVFLSTDREKCADWLEETLVQNRNQASRKGLANVASCLQAAILHGSQQHPALQTRRDAIEILVERLKTPEGEQAVLNEIIADLTHKHQEIFLHHYERPQGVTRG